MNVLSIRNLSKSFGQQQIIKSSYKARNFTPSFPKIKKGCCRLHY